MRVLGCVTKVLFFLLMFSQFSYSGEFFTKISSTGNELSDNAAEWSCVRNNDTGQIWEVKTTANKGYTYTFESASDYATQMNSQGLCGYSGWRIPKAKELDSILYKRLYNPAIDVSYFPNTDLGFDWWSSAYAGYSDDTGYLTHAWVISFYYGYLNFSSKLHGYHIRLVRGEQHFDFFDYTKLDSSGNDLPDDAVSWSCIRDNRNSLIWEVKTIENQNLIYTFDEASDYAIQANSQRMCGFNDWRMPDIKELISIVNYNTTEPAIKTDYFPNTILSFYWSATPGPVSNHYSWFINFNDGHVRISVNNYRANARLVRTKQRFLSLPAILFQLF